MLEWVDNLYLGIEIVDNQHKQIFEVINSLIESFEDGSEKDKTFDTLEFVENYVNKHFSTEEFYLNKFAYKDLESHINLHRDFSRKLEDYKFRHRKGGLSKTAALEMQEFLVDWWVNYILKVDSKYAELLKSKI